MAINGSLDMQVMANTWYRHFLDYDPSDDITSTKCPVMAINGSLDTQVTAASNLMTIKRLLPAQQIQLDKRIRGSESSFPTLHDRSCRRIRQKRGDDIT
jgi:hypothetical protein